MNTAMDRRRTVVRMALALGLAGVVLTTSALGQQGRGTRAPQGAAGSQPGQASTLDRVSGQGLTPVAVPVNPDDPVALVNGESISRRQLADECVARKGKEILDTLIARKLIEQACRAKHMEVTAAEIDAEIDRVARTMAGLGREAWLRTLDKERGISPVQYARDIIYPALALRKLASPLVTVTEQDMNDAFEAQFGEKLRCRIIMVDKLREAQEIWEEVKKNPGGFEKLAQDRSIDMTSRSLGGLLGEPITRHAYPRTVSDAAFLQLVDGDPKDKDPKHKPKDGDFTGPIQVSESTWAILRRERVVPATKANKDDPSTRRMIHDMMFDAKLKQKMGEVFQQIERGAAIENHLTGQTKLANEEQHPEHRVDGEVKLMSDPSTGSPRAAGGQAVPKAGPPAGLSPDAAKRAEALKRVLRQRPAASTDKPPM